MKLAIERPVLNYEQTDLAYLQARMHEALPAGIEMPPNLLQGLENLSAAIVSVDELQRLHSQMHLKVDNDHVRDLAALVIAQLPADELVVPTLPATLAPRKGNPAGRSSLVVAHAPQIWHEKQQAHRIIEAFYGLHRPPSRVWLSAEHAGVRLARSRNWTGRNILEDLRQSIMDDSTLLPGLTKLGKIAICE